MHTNMPATEQGNFRHVKIKEMGDSVSFCRAKEGRQCPP